MTLPLPNLDDRTYADLVEEAIAQIVVEYPEWTDHNPTDTGIILIELLAWLTEMTLYRVNQIPDQNYAGFVSLLKGEKWRLPDVSAQERQKILQSEIKQTLLQLKHRYRAVTFEDYEQLLLEDWNQSPDSNGLEIARVRCLAQRNLDQLDVDTFVNGHISLVVVPLNYNPSNEEEYNSEKLADFLKPRKLLTTRLHIVEPKYVSVAVEAELFIKDGAVAEKVKNKAKAEVEKFFQPLDSGKYWQGKGWNFGRSVYRSELYKMLDDLEGVDFVENLWLKDETHNSVPEIYLADNQLVNFKSEDSTFTIMVKVGNEHKKI